MSSSEATIVSWNNLFESILHQNAAIKMLKIPPYQRSYVWDEKQVVELVNSVMLACQAKREFYFLGLLVLSKEDDNSGSFFIVDGQQRITTLNIIMATIRFIAREKGFRKVDEKCSGFLEVDSCKRRERLPETRFKLCIPDKEKTKYGSEFRNYIQKGKINELRAFHGKSGNSIMNEYVDRLRENSNCVYDRLFDKEEDVLLDLVHFIGDKCEFNVQITDRFMDGHYIFCTLNSHAGKLVSTLELIHGSIYGRLIREKGSEEATRLIDSKTRVWSKINSELGEREMKCFLAHVYRIKVVEKGAKEAFMASFGMCDQDLFNCFGDSNSFDEFIQEITRFYEIWKSIFSTCDKLVSKEGLQLLRNNHWEIWLTIAIMAAHKGMVLSKDFWSKLEKFIAMKMLYLCSRYTSSDMESFELLDNCYDELRSIVEHSELQLAINDDDVEYCVERLKGDCYSKLTDNCLIYILMRIGLESGMKKSSIDCVCVDLVCPIRPQSASEWSKNAHLVAHADYLGNVILVEKEHLERFRNKEWSEKRSQVGLVKGMSLTRRLLEQPTWDFYSTQTEYLKTIGRIYDIEALKHYEAQVILKQELSDNGTPDLVKEMSGLTIKSVQVEIIEYDIKMAARLLSAYIVDNKTRKTALTFDGLKKAAASIDPTGSGYTDKDTILKVLLDLRDTHRVYTRRWEKTFKKWIAQETRDENGCIYPNIFIHHK